MISKFSMLRSQLHSVPDNFLLTVAIVILSDLQEQVYAARLFIAN